MVQIPDSIRPHLEFAVRHRFWLLLPLVPLLVLPTVLLANGSLSRQIESARSEIDGRLSALRSIDGIQPHPNESWSNEINVRTNAVKLQTLGEWRRFWDSQKPLRVWPDALGADFVQRAAALKPDGKLPRQLLERYQNGVRALVRKLPERMGADEAMVDAAGGNPGFENPGAGLRPGPAAQPTAATRFVQWSAEDQQRIYASFDWQKPPSTLQVLLAQEELWVYGLLADSIARVNKVAAGPYNAPISIVQQLAIGYPAAEDAPGGAGTRRIAVPDAAGAAGMDGSMPPPEMMSPDAMAAGGAAARPPHPRFGGGLMGPGQGPPPGMPAEEGAAAVSTDDALRNWIYVGFDGKPLTAEALAQSPDAMMVHLMPFAIKAVIDERHLDAWLVDLAQSYVPIDVRQVRINAEGSSSQPGGMPRSFLPQSFEQSGGGPAVSAGRNHDVTVELRGTVALATPPDAKRLGLAPEVINPPPAAATAPAAAAVPAEPVPPADAAGPDAGVEPPAAPAAAPAPAAPEAAPPVEPPPQPAAPAAPEQDQPPAVPPAAAVAAEGKEVAA